MYCVVVYDDASNVVTTKGKLYQSVSRERGEIVRVVESAALVDTVA